MNAVPDATWLALRQLTDTYAVALDTADLGLLSSLFTTDGEYLGPLGADGKPGFHLVGRNQIRQAGELLVGRFAQTLHVPGAFHVVTDRPKAAAVSTCVAFHLMPDMSKRQHLIRYQDKFRQEGGAWRIARREITSLWSQP